MQGRSIPTGYTGVEVKGGRGEKLVPKIKPWPKITAIVSLPGLQHKWTVGDRGSIALQKKG